MLKIVKEDAFDEHGDVIHSGIIVLDRTRFSNKALEEIAIELDSFNIDVIEYESSDGSYAFRFEYRK